MNTSAVALLNNFVVWFAEKTDSSPSADYVVGFAHALNLCGAISDDRFKEISLQCEIQNGLHHA